MLPSGIEAGLGLSAPIYLCHRPERKLLYQIIDEYYPAFKLHMEAQDKIRRAGIRSLPAMWEA